MDEKPETRPMGQVIQIDEARIRDHLGEMVRGTVEEALNAMLDADADRLCGAGRYERSEARKDKGHGMYMKAKELAEAHGWFLARQFETAANADIHESTTAQEILADFKDEGLDYFVTGYGTGGTVSGVGRILKKTWPEAKTILSEPANAQLVGSGTPQARIDDGGPASSHPAFEPHPIQGWTPDFIPLVLQEAIDGRYFDELIPIAAAEAMQWARALAAKEGIFTGISGGATFGVAMQIAERTPAGSTILAMLPDTGERYLSTPLFEPFGAEMNEEELAIMHSTPNYHML